VAHMAPGRGGGGGRADRHGDRELGQWEKRVVAFERSHLHGAAPAWIVGAGRGDHHIGTAGADNVSPPERVLHGAHDRQPGAGQHPAGADAVTWDLDQHAFHDRQCTVEDRLGVPMHAGAGGRPGIPGIRVPNGLEPRRQSGRVRDSSVGELGDGGGLDR